MWPYLIADVFTAAPLEGNATAVFTDADGLDGPVMQRLARETNLSETVFVLPAQAGGDARLRIFTPAAELPFAGHPTLGAAYLLCGLRGLRSITLETGAGLVAVDFAAAEPGAPAHPLLPHPPGLPGWMRQPLPTWRPCPQAGDLLQALGIAQAELPVEEYRNGPVHIMVALPDETAVAALRPDLSALTAVPAGVYCFAGQGADWKARLFAPGLGVPEDPATGSAAGPLAVHLARHGRIAFGDQIVIRQGAETGRPSRLHAIATGTPTALESVRVGGSVVAVGRGEFHL